LKTTRTANVTSSSLVIFILLVLHPASLFMWPIYLKQP